MGLGVLASGVWNQLNPLDSGRTFADAGREAAYNAAGYEPGSYTAAKQSAGGANPLDILNQPIAQLQGNSSNPSPFLNPNTAAPTGVLGVNTDQTVNTTNGFNTVGNGVNGSGYTQAQLDAYNQQFTDSIGRLNTQLGYIPGDQEKAYGLLNNTFNPQFDTLNNSLSSANRNLDFSASQNEQNKVKSFRDIGTGIRNSIQAMNNRLGTIGAADSSAAAVAAPYAFAQLQAQQRGGVLDNFNTNSAQINMKRQDVQSEYDTQFRMLQAEKGNRIAQIAAQYDQLRQQILDQMATADGQRRQLLASANQQAASQAIANIQALESQYRGLSDSITQKATAGIPQAQTAGLNGDVTLNGYQAPASVTPTIGSLANAQQAVSSVPLYQRKFDQASFIPPQFLNDNQIAQ